MFIYVLIGIIWFLLCIYYIKYFFMSKIVLNFISSATALVQIPTVTHL